MTYTLKRIGFLSAVKIAAIIAAAAAVLPIILLLLLNAVFKFLDIEIPPDVLGPTAGADRPNRCCRRRPSPLP